MLILRIVRETTHYIALLEPEPEAAQSRQPVLRGHPWHIDDIRIPTAVVGHELDLQLVQRAGPLFKVLGLHNSPGRDLTGPQFP